MTEKLSPNEEITQILNYLGRSRTEGEVSGSHITTILGYLITWKKGNLIDTYKRLAVRLGISYRHIKEDYVDGLRVEGLIHENGGNWEWRGLADINPELSTFMKPTQNLTNTQIKNKLKLKTVEEMTPEEIIRYHAGEKIYREKE